MQARANNTEVAKKRVMMQRKPLGYIWGLGFRLERVCAQEHEFLTWL